MYAGMVEESRTVSRPAGLPLALDLFISNLANRKAEALTGVRTAAPLICLTPQLEFAAFVCLAKSAGFLGPPAFVFLGLACALSLGGSEWWSAGSEPDPFLLLPSRPQSLSHIFPLASSV